jgi:hypothetical protein
MDCGQMFTSSEIGILELSPIFDEVGCDFEILEEAGFCPIDLKIQNTKTITTKIAIICDCPIVVKFYFC